MKYQDIDIAANVLLFHGKSPECWAHAAEYGSFSAFVIISKLSEVEVDKILFRSMRTKHEYDE
jgi:hypothetical protein